MGYLKYVRELWKKPKQNNSELYRERLIAWRRDPVTVRIDHPTRPDRARALGYKAKQGIFVVRQSISRGGHTRPNINHGRSPRKTRQRMVLNQNYQAICEQRANRKYNNCEVLGSYWVMEDGQTLWYEVILVDRESPTVKSNSQLAQVAKQRGRVFRGLTSASKKSRGLRSKGQGAEKVRPSRAGSYRKKLTTKGRKE